MILEHKLKLMSKCASHNHLRLQTPPMSLLKPLSSVDKANLFAKDNSILLHTKGVIDKKSECQIRRRIRCNQAINLITLKLKSKTVKPASKQISQFQVLFTRPQVLTQS